ncbi:hypothetical protein FYJ28_16465 [Arthrobacter sp. BL-252-APC-1A]|uniref:hypothetical protein n=1 Tax=Arthrobacter sp. BL-252-APC-1A TaxID=2606622 RepID=UPI0012B24AC8|nr:hypothetical protein [Arthrobacter sp. BL-252-APC-1A]MSS00398.1 hypothetical protein [Arthrobacter sp. BL-252-APC-1A]
MAEETDGIEEAFEGQLRVLVTAAGQIAERISRAREEASRRAQAVSEQAAREMQERFEAERKTAQLEVSRVHTPEWWDRATPEQMAHTYQVARAWTREDPEAARAEQTMRNEFRSRYNLDVDKTNADPAAVSAARQKAERDRADADAERHRAATEAAEAQLLLNQADQEDRRADEARLAAEYEHDPDIQAQRLTEAEAAGDRSAAFREDGRTVYDSADRREGTARDLESKGIDSELVAVRMRADVSQASAATEVVKTSRAKIPRSLKGNMPRGTQVQRPGINGR